MAENPETDPPGQQSVDKAVDPSSEVVPETGTADPPDAESAADAPENNAHKRSRKPFEYLGRLTVSEWLTFLVGVGSLVVSFLTWRTAADTSQLALAVGDLKQLATSSQTEATAMQNQLGEMQRQVRAYVSLVGFHIVQFEVGKPVIAQLIFTNEGQTPAYHAQIRFSQMGIDEVPAKAYVLTPLPAGTDKGGITIGPKGPFTSNPPANKPLEDYELKVLQRPVAVIGYTFYIQGVLSYRDAFGILRTTRFYGAYGGPYGINQTGAVAIVDGPGNESD